jgi:hypothetical protein
MNLVEVNPTRRCIAAAALFVLVFATAMSCRAQADARKLRKMPDEQLTRCYTDASVCGTTDEGLISRELSRRLPEMTREELMSCFVEWHVCGTRETEASGTPISDELARRGNPNALMDSYRYEQNPARRAGIEHVAYHFDTPQVLAFMLEVFRLKLDDGEGLYYPANYLAKRCDPEALQLLSSGKARGEGCLQFESTVATFGKCKYRPAIPYLVDSALADICGNIAEAAANDLKELYPDGPQTFDSPEDAQAFYCKAAKKEGFTLTCKSE